MVNDEELPPGNEHRLHMRCEYKFLHSKDEDNYCSEKFLQGTLAVGELCLLRPQQVNPTQPSIGKGMPIRSTLDKNFRNDQLGTTYYIYFSFSRKGMRAIMRI